MGEDGVALLVHWESFYVITGSAAAVLTGLQFVVVTLGAQLNRRGAEVNRAFGTPTIVHFGAVLLIAAIVSAPWPALSDVAFVLGLCGVAGLLYSAVIIQVARRQTTYPPVLEDWVWHFTLPPLAYAILLLAAIILQGNTTMSLFVVGATVLLLLFVGIHNAWDSVSFIALELRQQQGEREDELDMPKAQPEAADPAMPPEPNVTE
jgi:hypothetical protein